MKDNSDEIADALSSNTRTERKSLLISSIVLMTLSWGGLVPTKVSSLGLEMERVNELVLVAVAWGVTAYFLCAFMFYYRADRFVAEQKLQAYEEWLVANDMESAKETFGRAPVAEGPLHTTLQGLHSGNVGSFIRRRYHFDFWSAVVIGGASVIAGIVWIALRILS